jgi:hypothetical protein
MSDGFVPLERRGLGQTARVDAWWVQPLVVFLGLTAFIAYATWAAFQNAHYTFGPYLSPFYSPVLWASADNAGALHHAWLGVRPGWWPSWLPFSPALLILPFPAGFRLTCYYYRGAYYKSHWASPLSCTVGKWQQSYRGEHALPLLLQNAHRYFLYAALAFILILSWDAIKSFYHVDEAGQGHLWIGVGSLVLTLNVILLSGYTFGCHSLRHLIGGGCDEVSKCSLGAGPYHCVSALNRRHMLWAWLSLIWVALSDVYVRMCSVGHWTDWHVVF